MKNVKISDKFIRGGICILLLTTVMILVTYISLGGKWRDYNAYEYLDGNDGTATEMIIKSIHEYGIMGLYFNERVGAPDVASFIDANGLDLFMAISICIIDIFVDASPACLYYLFLYITFIATAFSMYYFLRKMSFGYVVSVTFAILFSIAPYHFYRYLVHISLGNAFSVPVYFIFAFYVIGIIRCETKLDKIAFIVLGILSGLANPYFTFFGLILAALAFVFRWGRCCNIKKAIEAMWVYVYPLLAIFFSQLPSLIYSCINGSNRMAFMRDYREQEMYGLKIIQLLLPVTYSRVPFLKNITADYYAGDYIENTENFMSSLGLIATIGFIAICTIFIIGFVFKDKFRKLHDDELLNFAAFTVISFLMIGVVGGLGEIFNMIVTPQFRCYNRLSIFIICICVTVVAYFINKLNFSGKLVLPALCFIIFLVGAYDSVYIYAKEDNANIQLKNDMYQSFFEKADNMLHEKAMVYQLPYADYPEAEDIYDFKVSKHFVGYLFSDDISWSYGGINGRNMSARHLYYDCGMGSYFIASLLEAGFSAVYIDCAGFEDGGVQIVSYYDSMGFPSVVSDDGMLYLFDITGFDVSHLDMVNYKAYEFTYYWISDFSGINPPDYLCAGIAQGISVKDEDSISNLYSYILYEDIVLDYSDEEYISFLYKRIFDVEAEQESIAYWKAFLEQGYGRDSVFKLFLMSQEFENKLSLLE